MYSKNRYLSYTCHLPGRPGAPGAPLIPLTVGPRSPLSPWSPAEKKVIITMMTLSQIEHEVHA